MSQSVLRPLLILSLSLALSAAEPVATPGIPAPVPLPPPVSGPLPAPATGVTAPKPFLGVTIEEARAGEAPGLPISDVKALSTAASLGLEPGDRLLSVNGKSIKIVGDLQTILGGSKVGDLIQVEFTRSGTPQSAKGTLLPRHKPQDLPGEVASVQRQIEEVRQLAAAKAKEPSLSDILQQVKELEDGLPKAVAAFKKQYPDGTFDIRVSITISTDKNAKTPLEFTNVKDPGTAPPPADKKPEEAASKPEAKTPAPAPVKPPKK